jgi:hypothetical protein
VEAQKEIGQHKRIANAFFVGIEIAVGLIVSKGTPPFINANFSIGCSYLAVRIL